MKHNVVLALAAALISCILVSAQAEEKANSPVKPAAAVQALTPQQFEALPPTAIIEVDGKKISKQEFLAQREAEIKKAFENMKAQRSRAAAEFAAQRKTFLDAQKAKLDAANQKVQAEVDRLRAADATSHGANWEARREQAATLLRQAATADPEQQSRLQKQAADLLAPARP